MLPMSKQGLKIPALETGKPEVSMAPLIDIVFLLLIFFMVTTVFPDNKGLTIERPISENTETLTPNSLVIKIDQNGQLFYQSENITLAQLSTFIRQHKSQHSDTSVLIQADHRATTQALISAMDACRDAGISHVGIATDAPQR